MTTASFLYSRQFTFMSFTFTPISLFFTPWRLSLNTLFCFIRICFLKKVILNKTKSHNLILFQKIDWTPNTASIWLFGHYCVKSIRYVGNSVFVQQCLMSASRAVLAVRGAAHGLLHGKNNNNFYITTQDIWIRNVWYMRNVSYFSTV